MTTIEEGDTYRRDVNEAEFAEAVSQLREGGEVDPESAGNDFDRWLLRVQEDAWQRGYYTGKRDYAGWSQSGDLS